MVTKAYPPGPKGKPILGHYFEFIRDPTNFLLNLAREYGDIVRFKLGPWDAYLLNHPDYIKEVLVTKSHHFHQGPYHYWLKRSMGNGLLTSEQGFHLRQRRLAQPAFHQKRIAAYAETMTRYAALICTRWQDGEAHDIAHEMTDLTLSIVAKTLFDVDVEVVVKKIGAAVRWSISMCPYGPHSRLQNC